MAAVIDGIAVVTALLTADEAACLTLGVNVIVRAGDHPDWCSGNRNWSECECWGTDPVAPQDWVALTGPCPTTCQQPSERGDGTLCGDDYEVSLVDVVRYEGDGESTFFHLPLCYGHRLALGEHVIAYEPCPDCRDGRRIELLFADMPNRIADGTGIRAVGRGSIEVVPVTTEFLGDQPKAYLDSHGLWLLNVGRLPPAHGPIIRRNTLDPLPIPGRDWGVIIYCVELA